MLHEPCTECGLNSAEVDVGEIGRLVRASLPHWAEVLERPEAQERPSKDVWSATEYACHVRDVFDLFERRLQLMRDQHDPEFANWDQNVTAVEDDYASQDPATVLVQLLVAGNSVAAAFDTVGLDEHARTGRRSNGSVFTIATFGQYFWHDVFHHLHDVLPRR